MPLTQLDVRAALIVIDLQKGIVGLPAASSASEVIQRAAQLARAFRARQLPVVLVNVAGRAPGRINGSYPKMPLAPDWTELVPELDHQPGDIRITKRRIGAFIGTNLHDQLQERGVTQVFLAGIATSIGVESTARSAYDHGYNVVFVADAMTDRNAEVHQFCIDKIFQRLGEIDTTDHILERLRS